MHMGKPENLLVY